MSSLSEYINQINTNMRQHGQRWASQEEIELEKARTQMMQALQSQQNTTNSVYQSGTSAPNWGGGGGTTGGVWTSTQAGTGGGGAYAPPASFPTFPTLPTPTGTKLPVQFTDAFGHVTSIMVDSAYIGVLNFISHAHRNSTSDAYKISTRPSMDDGEFSEEELERAQVIIDELGAKPKAEAHG